MGVHPNKCNITQDSMRLGVYTLNKWQYLLFLHTMKQLANQTELAIKWSICCSVANLCIQEYNLPTMYSSAHNISVFFFLSLTIPLSVHCNLVYSYTVILTWFLFTLIDFHHQHAAEMFSEKSRNQYRNTRTQPLTFESCKTILVSIFILYLFLRKKSS